MFKKPKLVDPSWFEQPVNIVKKSQVVKRIEKSDNSLIINIIGLLILIIGGLCLYYRLKEREEKELEKQNVILGFHQYVKDNIK